jgi:hypothetical protein
MHHKISVKHEYAFSAETGSMGFVKFLPRKSRSKILNHKTNNSGDLQEYCVWSIGGRLADGCLMGNCQQH